MERQLEYTENAIRALRNAAENTANTDNTVMVTQALLLGLIEVYHGRASKILSKLGIAIDALMMTLVDELSKSPMTGSEGEPLVWSEDADEVLSLAQVEARSLEASSVGTEHILLALIKIEKAAVTPLLLDEGADYETVLKMVKDGSVLSAEAPSSESEALDDKEQKVKQSTIAPNIFVPDDSSALQQESSSGDVDEAARSEESEFDSRGPDQALQEELTDLERESQRIPIQMGGPGAVTGGKYAVSGGSIPASEIRVSLLETLKRFGLTPSGQFRSFMNDAWANEWYMMRGTENANPEDVVVSDTAFLWASLTGHAQLLDVVQGAGFDWGEFLNFTELDGYETLKRPDIEDVNISQSVLGAIVHYAGQFQWRSVLDHLAIAFGILSVSVNKFEQFFKGGLSDVGKAEITLRDLIEAEMQEPDHLSATINAGAAKVVLSTSGPDVIVSTPPRKPPTAKTHTDRWTNEDRLGYDRYAYSIAKFITHKETKPPLVVGVSAPWGQGKTSLMRMVQQELDPGHPQLVQEKDKQEKSDSPKVSVTLGRVRELLANDDTKKDDFKIPLDKIKKPRLTVWFNAWKYENSEQVWAGLAHAILSQLTNRLSAPQRELFWLKMQLKRIDTQKVRQDIYRFAWESFIPSLFFRGLLVLGLGVLAGLAVLAIDTWLIDLSRLMAYLSRGGDGELSWVALLIAIIGTFHTWTKEKEKALKKQLEGTNQRWVRQPDYEGRLGFLHLVEDDLRRAFDLLVSPEQPAVIFIDDLDRCSPTKVAQVIEAVNLFLAGDYPACHFVLGIDAEIVAASLEVVHTEILDKLTDRKKELGWCFMDKFIQLPFIIPQLTKPQREHYLSVLLTQEKQDVDKAKVAIEKAEQIKKNLTDKKIDVDEAADQAKEIASEYAKADREGAKELAKQIIDEVASKATDDDEQMLKELQNQFDYLTDNPRTIKRVVNLYRFHRFLSYGRRTSGLDLAHASPEQIARWSVVLVRWPSFIRFIQKDHLGNSHGSTVSMLQKVIDEAKSEGSVAGWTEALGKLGIIHTGWGADADLYRFLKDESNLTNDEHKLPKATEYGMW